MAFAIWTIFYSASLKDRVKGLIGVVLGFVAAVVMMLITSSFNLNLFTISISSLVGVFLVNFLVMHFDKTEKVWMNSLSGIFAGIFLTFSGFGVGLSPLSSVENAFLMFGMLILYTILGLVCGYFSTFITSKVKKRLTELEEISEPKEKKDLQIEDKSNKED